MHLGPFKVKPNSHIRAAWQCNKCPDGQLHVWTAEVQARTRGTQCPFCAGKLICLHNSLATIAPDVARYWDHSRNKKTPEQVLAGSGLRAEWKCPDCGWEWQAPVYKRIRRRAGCPKCSQALKVIQPQPTLDEAQPACLAEWDYERNNKEGFHPELITLGSHKKAHWICSRCPRGQPHRWTASLIDRVGRGTGCPVCGSQQTCSCNSLEALFPTVAAEFDMDKNGFAPSDITAHSSKMVWWRNATRGSWRQSPHSRNTSSRKDKV